MPAVSVLGSTVAVTVTLWAEVIDGALADTLSQPEPSSVEAATWNGIAFCVAKFNVNVLRWAGPPAKVVNITPPASRSKSGATVAAGICNTTTTYRGESGEVGALMRRSP